MAAKAQDFLDKLAAQFPEFWAWLQERAQIIGKGGALEKIRRMAETYAASATGAGHAQYQAFVAAVQGLASFAAWESGSEDVPDEDDDDEDDDEDEPPPPPPPPGAEEDTSAQENLLAALQQFLLDNELPLTLIDFIKTAIAQKKGYDQIILELRQTPEYKAAYPENELRRENGFTWMPESEIRAYRDEAKRLAAEYMGLTISNAEISGLIAKNASLVEWERRLKVWANVEMYGDAVQQVFVQELGMPLSDERLYMFFSPDVETPELDRAYAHALYRGQPTSLGLEIRPEEEAELLTQFGVSPEQAFQGYQGIVSELPKYERWAQIERFLNDKASEFPDGGGLGAATFGQLFRAIQLRDPEALTKLAAMQAREIARFRAGGGPTGSGTSATGLTARWGY